MLVAEPILRADPVVGGPVAPVVPGEPAGPEAPVVPEQAASQVIESTITIAGKRERWPSDGRISVARSIRYSPKEKSLRDQMPRERAGNRLILRENTSGQESRLSGSARWRRTRSPNRSLLKHHGSSTTHAPVATCENPIAIFINKRPLHRGFFA
jgi:hypothetical protein